MTASTTLAPRNRRRASTIASGRPMASEINRLTAVVPRLSTKASTMTGEPIASRSAPPAIERTTSAATGSARNSVTTTEIAVSPRPAIARSPGLTAM